jgi:transposase
MIKFISEEMKMPRYKDYSYDQQLMLPINLDRQILPGTFEYTLHILFSEKLDLSVFNDRYKNEDGGAPAYDPAVLLKIILFAYSRGITSSRKIARLCDENIICMALSADTHPHYTTIADFIATMDTECIDLFTRVLAICYTENLIGKEMFAIDGCKISSNCSKEWSGTKAELLRKREKIRTSIAFLVDKQQRQDTGQQSDEYYKREEAAIRKLEAKVDKISSWLDEHDDRIGATGKPVKSNITDNESAKMVSSHGVIQGYNGIAAVDDRNQVIVWAGAYGDINESGHLPEILQDLTKQCRSSGISDDILKTTTITADSGFHNEVNMKYCIEHEIDAYIPDNKFRSRDVRFNACADHKKKTENWKSVHSKKYFGPEDFHHNKRKYLATCPAGHPLKLNMKKYKSRDGKLVGTRYRGSARYCGPCELRAKCLRNPNSSFRQVTFFSPASDRIDFLKIARERFDTPQARSIYSRRMGTVEPVFGDMAGDKHLDRFTYRGRDKVNTQRRLFCLVHNIGKLKLRF